MEADILELWLYFSQRYLAKYGERPNIRLSDRDSIILALLDLENDDEHPNDDYDFD
jgi:hypothetical protein